MLEDLWTKYPTSPVLFYARLKQAQLLCKRGEFAAAQQMYEEIVSKFSQHREVSRAELALADCHAAQVSSDDTHQQSAENLYEQLYDSPAAPVDLRVEAGFKYGLNLSNRGNVAAARDAWWGTVNKFLLDDTQATLLGPKGRSWIAKTLSYYAQLMEAKPDLEEAGRAYELILKKGLPFESTARDRLARIRPVASAIAKP
jgi:tetratricopeptide (TPR) repeat protein